ncbi:hypothetical protein GCM10009754_73850 [Amycolatopsis minnesotensis]|uniref:Uncharacterized protein n=1 Tax=Amycolatopsis minnesotensis TaxID=337894 RepID=A0ABP5DSD3_9PSEU
MLFYLHRARLIIIGLVLIGLGVGLLYLDAGRVLDAIADNLIGIGGVSLLGDFAARTIANVRMIELFKNALGSVFYGPFRTLVERMTRAPFYRYDTRINVTLSAANQGTDGKLFALVRCSHRTNEPLGARSFLCSPQRYNQDHYRQHGITDYWIVNPAHGLAAHDPETYALVDYRVNGISYEITRTVDGDEQTYTVIPQGASIPAGDTFVETYTYRVLIPQQAHWVSFTVDVPTCGYTIEVSHFDTNINRLSLSPFFASETEPRATTSTAAHPGPASVAVDGWIMPTSGTVITWTLN